MATGKPDLPIHFRTGLRAVGIVNGRPVWPILGGSEPPPAPPAQPAPPPTPNPPAPPAPPGPPPPADPPSDLGFPEHTPVEQMKPEQREAYWKHQAKNWQSRANGNYTMLQQLGVKNADEVPAVKAKLDAHAAMEHELLSDKDKAVAEATDAAKAEARAELIPDLVQAKFEAAAGGRLSDEQIKGILAPLDLKYFLDASGKVDTGKVKTYVEQLAPAKGTTRTGPTPTGQGTRTASDAAGTAKERADARLERLGVKTPAKAT